MNAPNYRVRTVEILHLVDGMWSSSVLIQRNEEAKPCQILLHAGRGRCKEEAQHFVLLAAVAIRACDRRDPAESRMWLAANFRKYGNGPDFWDAYQRLLDSAARGSEFKAEAANRLALLAQEMGIVQHAQLL